MTTRIGQQGGVAEWVSVVRLVESSQLKVRGMVAVTIIEI